MRILIDAFLDHNFGDDIMLEMLINQLDKFDIFVLSRNRYIDNLSKFPNAQIFNCPKNIFKLFFLHKKFSIFIKLGGSIYDIGNDGPSINKWIHSLKRLFLTLVLWVNKKNDMRLFVIGCNTGPFGTYIAKLSAKWELSFAEAVTTRDIESYCFVKKSSKNVYYFPDIVLSNPYLQQLSTQNRKPTNFFGISVYKCADNAINEVFINKIASIINYINEYTDKNTMLLVFDTGKENDMESAFAIQDCIILKHRVQIIAYENDYKSMMDSITCCEALIAVRFHTAIISLGLGIPFLPIIYSNKMNNLLNDLHYEGPRFQISELSAIHEEIITELLVKKESLCVNRAYSACTESSGHFRVLKKQIDWDKNTRLG